MKENEHIPGILERARTKRAMLMATGDNEALVKSLSMLILAEGYEAKDKELTASKASEARLVEAVREQYPYVNAPGKIEEALKSSNALDWHRREVEKAVRKLQEYVLDEMKNHYGAKCGALRARLQREFKSPTQQPKETEGKEKPGHSLSCEILQDRGNECECKPTTKAKED